MADLLKGGSQVASHEATEEDLEITAIGLVHAALKGLDQEAQRRVLEYVAKKLTIAFHAESGGALHRDAQEMSNARQQLQSEMPQDAGGREDTAGADDLEGISPVARKWMRRNALTASQLSAVFSLGVDEIDLVARTIPGKSKKDKMRSVLLMKGVAAYLSGGAARVTHEQAKEACLHYDAYDVDNFAAYLRGMASEVTGNRESGYTLTARGLSNATEIVRQMTVPSGK